MPPQFVSLGPLMFNTYTLLIGLAAVTPIAWAWLRTRDTRIFFAALVMALFALAFGRAGYVALNWNYFRDHANEIVSLAGVSEQAALLGAVIGYWLLAKTPSPIANSQYLVIIVFLLICIAASVGCIPNGCAYGREVFWQTDGERSLAWLLRVDWPDAYSINAPRWPTQLFMVGWVCVGAAFVLAMARWRGDKVAWAALVHPVTSPPCHLAVLVILFALGDFLIQFLRGDPALMVGGMRVYQWLDLALAGCAVLILGLQLRRKL